MMKKQKIRDFHKLAMIRKEARGFCSSIDSAKLYSRKTKHKNQI